MEKSLTKRFGILTAGGDCPGLNAAIRGVCRAAQDKYGMTVVGIANGFLGLINRETRVLESKDFSGILTRGGTILGASREKPFKDRSPYPYNLENDKVEIIKENYRQLKLDCLVVLGGNGTLSTAFRLAREGLNVLGLPKTIDNDIEGTDRSFGFSSAVDIGTQAIDRLHSTATSHGRVMVLEVMGHKTGWLALYSGIAGGGDIIIMPEFPYDIKAIARHLDERAQDGKSFSIVVVAEGSLSAGEALMDKKERKKSRERMAFPSIGYKLAREIEDETGVETRVTVLGYIQRGGMPGAADRVLATSLGTAAADLLARGEYGRMVSIRGDRIDSVDLSVPAGETRTIPEDYYMLDTAVSVGTCLGV
ncbi:MAG: 6-phosphofructokinase [Spirochaetaceae bacterium]|nr:6-phosphofructokinase [Spirochaetaceae bacterium]